MKEFKSKNFNLLYDTWGPVGGRPVLFFHGAPGSHIQASAMLPLLDKHKIFLIACDRPGYGGTKGTGSNIEFLDAQRELLSSLNIQKFEVLGVSGGAPWAHMMTSRFADDVLSMVIVCGLATYNQQTSTYFSNFQNRGMKLKKILPSVVSAFILNGVLRFLNPEKKLAQLRKILNASDQEILQDPKTLQLMLTSIEQAKAQGAKGLIRDLQLFLRDWLQHDCDCERLKTVPTFYFHGQQDRILHHEMSTWMHNTNPKSRIKFFAEEGHYSLPFRQAESILSHQ